MDMSHPHFDIIEPDRQHPGTGDICVTDTRDQESLHHH
jgi:hypothetical protein